MPQSGGVRALGVVPAAVEKLALVIKELAADQRQASGRSTHTVARNVRGSDTAACPWPALPCDKPHCRATDPNPIRGAA